MARSTTRTLSASRSATYAWVPDGLTATSKGEVPTGKVTVTVLVSVSMTVSFAGSVWVT
nr:hypothetical protein [Streptomyces sp. McG3]